MSSINPIYDLCFDFNQLEIHEIKRAKQIFFNNLEEVLANPPLDESKIDVILRYIKSELLEINPQDPGIGLKSENVVYIRLLDGQLQYISTPNKKLKFFFVDEDLKSDSCEKVIIRKEQPKIESRKDMAEVLKEDRRLRDKWNTDEDDEN